MIHFHRRIALLLAAMLGSSLALAEDESLIKDSAKAAVSSAISAGKNLLGGITEGVTDGRGSTQGADGSMIISAREQLEGRVQIDVLKVEPEGDKLNVVLGLKNSTESQLRLINLKQTGALLAIDQDGYSNPLTVGLENPDDVTIPAKTGVRQKFVFAGPVERGTHIRLWGQDFPVAK
jgi:hypothetical protein